MILMCFLGLVNAFGMRGCLSIAITEMTVPVTKPKNFTDDTCTSMEVRPPMNDINHRQNKEFYDWSESTQVQFKSLK